MMKFTSKEEFYKKFKSWEDFVEANRQFGVVDISRELYEELSGNKVDVSYIAVKNGVELTIRCASCGSNYFTEVGRYKQDFHMVNEDDCEYDGDMDYYDFDFNKCANCNEEVSF